MMSFLHLIITARGITKNMLLDFSSWFELVYLKNARVSKCKKYLNCDHSSDIRNTSIFRRCSKRSIFKYFLKNIIKIQRLENWPLYQVFSSIFKKAQKNIKYVYV